MTYEFESTRIPDWLTFTEIVSKFAWRYVGSPNLRFRLNDRDINVSKLEIGESGGTIYINLTEECPKTCVNCAYARMDGYEFAIHCQHKKSDFYDEDFDNPVSEDDTCEYFKNSNVDIRFRDEEGGEE